MQPIMSYKTLQHLATPFTDLQGVDEKARRKFSVRKSKNGTRAHF